jgi:hypothetical protein
MRKIVDDDFVRIFSHKPIRLSGTHPNRTSRDIILISLLHQLGETLSIPPLHIPVLIIRDSTIMATVVVTVCVGYHWPNIEIARASA